MCLGNISKDFTINNMKNKTKQKNKKNRIKRTSAIFFVEFDPIDTKDILDIHKYLMKGT